MNRFMITVLLLAFASTAVYSQWEEMRFPWRTPNVLLDTPQGLLAANSSVIYKSTDNGATWDSLSAIEPIAISEIIMIGDVLLINTSRVIIWPSLVPSLFRSEDYGKTWTPVMEAVYGGSSITCSNSKVYADLDGKLYCSADTGKTWSVVNTDLSFTDVISGVISDGNTLLARIQNYGLYKSSDDALTWEKIETDFSNDFYYMDVQGLYVYVGTFRDGFFVSKDEGNTWQNASAGLPDSAGVRALHICGDNIVASISKDFQQSIYRYDIVENTWHLFNDGYYLKYAGYITDIESNSEYVFVASDSAVWRRPLSDLITGINLDKDELASDFYLRQNYPNPFNPTTVISYQLPVISKVQLKVYDVLGREVATLVDEEKPAGSYEVEFNGEGLTSGVYFYQLKAGDYFRINKMLLLK